MAVHVAPEARRSVLVDLLTVHALGGKAIIFTQTKREADEVAASVSLVHPCEVGGPRARHRLAGAGLFC